MKYQEAYNLCLNHIWEGTKNQDECERIGELWGDTFPGFDLKRISAARIRSLCEMWKHSLSPATINRRVAVLSRILHHAHDLGYLAKVPKMPFFREAPAVERFLTEDEEVRLLATMSPGTPLHCAIVFLIQTGIRVGELFSIRESDVREDGILHLRAESTKTSSPRSIPLTSEALRAFRRTQILCPGLWGALWSRSQFSHLWARARKEAYLPDLRLHDLRHTFASRLAQKGRDIYTIAHLLGHSDINTTKRYAHLNTAALATALGIDPDE